MQDVNLAVVFTDICVVVVLYSSLFSLDVCLRRSY